MWTYCDRNISHSIETIYGNNTVENCVNSRGAGSSQHETADIEHVSTIAGSLVSISSILHEQPRYGTNDAGYDTEHNSLNSDLGERELRRELLRDKWRLLFDMFDPEGFGEITVNEFTKALRSPEFVSQVPVNKRELLLERAKKATLHNGPGYITFQDFVNVMSGKRTRSFKCAVHHRDREVCSENDFHFVGEETPFFKKMVNLIAMEILPEVRDRKYYADRYSCCPPPWFILLVTIFELILFAYNTLSAGEADPVGPVPIDSLFIYRPDKRHELWRFISYMFLHAGWIHLGFNLLIQLLFGLPLEMVHGSGRIGCIYFSGVLAGSLGTSIIDPEVYLVGASGGVYSLLAAHLANVMINYHQMRYGILRLAAILFFASFDVGFAIYARFADDYPSVSFIAHLTGALAGLTIGLLVLKNFEQKLHEQLLWWIALGIYAACIIFAIIFNILNSGMLQSLKAKPIYATETFYNNFQV